LVAPQGDGTDEQKGGQRGPKQGSKLQVQAFEGVVEALVLAPDRFPVVRLAMKHEPILSDVAGNPRADVPSAVAPGLG
jgi:hypothetical protein